MNYPRNLLKTLAILGPMAVALSSYATEPAQAQAYDCNGYYNPNCTYPYPYGPYAYDPYAYPYPYGGAFFFFGDGDHRRDHHFDHHFDHGGGFHHGGFGHGGFGHGGMGHGGFGHGGGGHGH
jgi:hypothetical protein